MRALTTIALAAGVAGVVTATAAANAGTKVLHGTFSPVVPVSTSPDYGRAVLIDGPNRDLLRIGVRRLAPHSGYIFRLRQGRVACRPDAPGTDVPGWRYRQRGVFKTDRFGNARSGARSRTFSVRPGVRYYVGVYTLSNTGVPGRLVICAPLRERATITPIDPVPADPGAPVSPDRNRPDPGTRSRG
jgi:hypothetical protein